MNNFHGAYFHDLWSPKFVMVDGYNRDMCLERFQCLVHYQVLGEPGIASCSHWSGFYLGGVDLCACLLIDHHRIILFFGVSHFHS